MSWSPQYTVGRLNFLGSMLRRIKNAAAHKKLVDIETQAHTLSVAAVQHKDFSRALA